VPRIGVKDYFYTAVWLVNLQKLSKITSLADGITATVTSSSIAG